MAVGFDKDFRDIAYLDDSGDIVAFDSQGANTVLVVESHDQPRIVAIGLGETLNATDVTRQFCYANPDERVHVEFSLGVELQPQALADWRAKALTAVSADLLGVMSGALDLAVKYAGDRHQFDRAIGSFQAIQHLCADQLVSIEGSRALVYHAAWALDHRPIEEALLAAQTAKALCSELGQEVCEAVIQVHGGMGFTWDCMAHLFWKRALLDRALFGSELVQLSDIAATRRDMSS